MLLYHGSYADFTAIDLSKCKEGKDFGRGFYVTSSLNQAARFVSNAVIRAKKENLIPQNSSSGYVIVFRLENISDINTYIFENADPDWLHFVASNRREQLFPEINKKFNECDIIGGKIANDRTASTLQLYTSGAFGIPGTSKADSIAISTLLPERLCDQFCFKSEKSVSRLSFIRSIEYGI